ELAAHVDGVPVEGQIGIADGIRLQRAVVDAKDGPGPRPLRQNVEAQIGVAGEVPLVAYFAVADELVIRRGEAPLEVDGRHRRHRGLGIYVCRGRTLHAKRIDGQRWRDADDPRAVDRMRRGAVDVLRAGLVRTQEPVRVVANFAGEARVENEVPGSEALALR